VSDVSEGFEFLNGRSGIAGQGPREINLSITGELLTDSLFVFVVIWICAMATASLPKVRLD